MALGLFLAGHFLIGVGVELIYEAKDLLVEKAL